MRFPQNMKKGDTIGFVAPSFGCRIEPYRSGFENAQKRFKQLGYRIQLGPNCYEGCGVGISNTPKACAEEFVRAYADANSSCLISCGGGELMCEILEHIDFDLLKRAAPKWFMGYSDNTNLTYLLATICDTASIYGPCGAAFGMEPWHPALQDAMNLLCGESLTADGAYQVRGYDKWEKDSLKSEVNPLAPYHVTEERLLHVYQGEQELEKESLTGSNCIRFQGRLLGGCMDCLVNLTGTRFDRTQEFQERYREDGIIWFLEACDLNVFDIRRAMWQMDQAGWFRYTKGFLIGRPLCIGQEMMGLDAYQAILPAASKYHVPIIMDVDLGHLPPMMPLIVGSYAQVTVCRNEISVEMKADAPVT